MQELARPVARIRLVPVHSVSDGINTWMTENADITRRIDEQEVRTPSVCFLCMCFTSVFRSGILLTVRIFRSGPCLIGLINFIHM